MSVIWSDSAALRGTRPQPTSTVCVVRIHDRCKKAPRRQPPEACGFGNSRVSPPTSVSCRDKLGRIYGWLRLTPTWVQDSHICRKATSNGSVVAVPTARRTWPLPGVAADRHNGPMTIAIRPANGEDAADVSRIYAESWSVGFGDLLPPPVHDRERTDRWAAELTAVGAVRWWVAVRGGRVAGFVGIGPSRDPVDSGLGELDTIAVDPAYWRAGVGSALMATALEGLSRAGYQRAILWTVAGYERGHGFYEAHGWRRDESLARDDGRQIAFRRDIPPA